jgi:hypothetical protein
MGFEAAPAAEERTGACDAFAALAAGVAWHPLPSARSMAPTIERTAPPAPLSRAIREKASASSAVEKGDLVFVFGVFMTEKMQRRLDPR